MTDRMLEHGRTLDGLAPSTYEATLATSLMVGYHGVASNEVLCAVSLQRV